MSQTKCLFCSKPAETIVRNKSGRPLGLCWDCYIKFKKKQMERKRRQNVVFSSNIEELTFIPPQEEKLEPSPQIDRGQNEIS